MSHDDATEARTLDVGPARRRSRDSLTAAGGAGFAYDGGRTRKRKGGPIRLSLTASRISPGDSRITDSLGHFSGRLSLGFVWPRFGRICSRLRGWLRTRSRLVRLTPGSSTRSSWRSRSPRVGERCSGVRVGAACAWRPSGRMPGHLLRLGTCASNTGGNPGPSDCLMGHGVSRQTGQRRAGLGWDAFAFFARGCLLSPQGGKDISLPPTTPPRNDGLLPPYGARMGAICFRSSSRPGA